MKKRILALALALAMLLPCFAIGASATLEDEAQALMEQTSAILTGGKYTLKAQGASPFGGKPTTITFVVDGSRTGFEVTLDWVGMMRAMDPGNVRSVFYGWVMQLVFGKKIRFVTTGSQSLIMCLSRRYYADAPDVDGVITMAEMFGDVFIPPVIGDVTASKVTMGGKEYLCAELTSEDGLVMRYYFLDGALKRIEMDAVNPETGTPETLTFEIYSLTATADESFFSTKWMFKLSLGGMLPKFSLF